MGVKAAAVRSRMMQPLQRQHPSFLNTGNLPLPMRQERVGRFKMAKAIGIDAGTTNSCVAIMEGATPRVIENAEGRAPHHWW